MTLTAHVRADDLLALDTLRRALGDCVLADTATRDYYANDIFWQPGIAPLAVVLPRTREEAAEAVRLATDAGLSVVPRGGGMSYTKGYLPDRADSIVVDARKLDRILEAERRGPLHHRRGRLHLGEAQRGARRNGPAHRLLGAAVRRRTPRSAARCRRTAPSSARPSTASSPTSVLGVTVVLADGAS